MDLTTAYSNADDQLIACSQVSIDDSPSRAGDSGPKPAAGPYAGLRHENIFELAFLIVEPNIQDGVPRQPIGSSVARSRRRVLRATPRISRVSFNKRVIKELFGSACRCAFPGCREKLVVEHRGVSTINVDIAHIRSSSRRGPRHDEDYPPEWLDEARNLLLLCTKHHRLVDPPVDAASTYTVAELESWKRDQVADGIGDALPDSGTEEIFRFYERFDHRIKGDLEFGRWRPETEGIRTPSPVGGAAGFASVADDPVSVSAAWSVAQLLDGFAPAAVVPPKAASAFGASVAAFLLDEKSGFTTRVVQLEHCCRTEPFETMLTSIVFAVTAVRSWETVVGQPAGLLRDDWVATGLTIPYLADIVMAARYGKTDHDPLPGHPDDQQKVTMNLGKVTAMTLQLTTEGQPNPLVSIVQDLLIGVQRVPAE